MMLSKKERFRTVKADYTVSILILVDDALEGLTA